MVHQLVRVYEDDGGNERGRCSKGGLLSLRSGSFCKSTCKRSQTGPKI